MYWVWVGYHFDSPFLQWKIDEEDAQKEYDDTVEIVEEVTAHFCTKCHQITGFWINILANQNKPAQ